MTKYLIEPDINLEIDAEHEEAVSQFETITLPSRINHMQAGTNKTVYEQFIKGKELQVVSKSKSGKFIYVLVAGEKHAFHVDDLVSNEDYVIRKGKEFKEWMALSEDEKMLILANRSTPYEDE